MRVKNCPKKLVLMELDGLLDDTQSAADRCNSTDADQCSFPKKENYDEFLNSSEGIIKKAASSIRVKATTKTENVASKKQKSKKIGSSSSRPVSVVKLTANEPPPRKRGRPRKHPETAKQTQLDASFATTPKTQALFRKSVKSTKQCKGAAGRQIRGRRKVGVGERMKGKENRKQKEPYKKIRGVTSKTGSNTQNVCTSRVPTALNRSRSMKKAAKKKEEGNKQKRKYRKRRDISTKPLAGSQTNVKLMATRILTRFGRNVKRVQRYGVALELRQPWERKKVADVRIVKEKQQEKSREKICARDSEFKFASMKMTKASASAGVKVNVKRAPGEQDYVIEREMVNKKVDSKIFKNFQEDSNVKSHEVSAVREEANLHTSREMSAAEDVVAENIAEEGDSTIVQEAVRPALRAVRNSKQRQREIKRATRDAERRVKLEEIQKKREARKLKKEMKEKLLRAKRERREAERKKLEEEQLELKRKKRAITTLKKSTDERKVFVPSPCDDVMPIVDMSFCWRIFVSGKVFLNRWLILHEIQSYRYGVVAYYVVENSEDKTQGLLYVQDIYNPFAGLPEEAYFLELQSERGRSCMFQTITDARFVSSTAQSPTFFYYVVILRESASLKDIWTHYPEPSAEKNEKKAWSLGTVGRLAADILSIIEVTYEAGYTFRNIDMCHFHLDMRTRRLYLDNASEVVVSTELREPLRLASGEYVYHNYWRGSIEYAPLSWHYKGRESIMRVADCAEVLFYIMVDMLGLLTWRGLDNHQTTKHKEGFVEQNRKQLPVPLIDYWKIVRRAQAIDVSKLRRQDDYLLLDGIRGGATVSILDFRALFTRLLALYKVFGGVADEDTPFDFEVVDDLLKRSPEEQRLVELYKEAEMLRYRLEALRADYDALITRKAFAQKNAAQTERERALAAQHRSDIKDRVYDDADAILSGGFLQYISSAALAGICIAFLAWHELVFV
ncbi:hypothetical protein RB195_004939 [Necator americanus]|uniref:Protein kinase domain-containing protein n=1 Tax=Necator americanus TaxID=51031 RepID=A0ABR1BNR4_NECAM